MWWMMLCRVRVDMMENVRRKSERWKKVSRYYRHPALRAGHSSRDPTGTGPYFHSSSNNMLYASPTVHENGFVQALNESFIMVLVLAIGSLPEHIRRL